VKTLSWIRLAQYVFTLIAVAALGYCAWAWLDARLYQARVARQFHRHLHLAAIPAPAPCLPRPVIAPAEGGLVGRLRIPRLGLSVMVVEGVADRDLRRAVGHIPGTALPGQSGNVAIAGHRDTFFRPLRSIRPDDTITLRTLTGAYCYRVVSTRVVSPRDVAVVAPTRHDCLTLVTCFPFYYVGAAPERFIVSAVQTAPATSPTSPSVISGSINTSAAHTSVSANSVRRAAMPRTASCQ
jgi:sortase A